MDFDKSGCLAARHHLDATALTFVDQSTAMAVLIVIYGIAGICMAATVAIITGLGLTRLLLPPIEVPHWAQPDQVRRVNGSVDAQVE